MPGSKSMSGRARGQEAFDCAPFEVVVSNPPYVPTPPVDDGDAIPCEAGPSWAWNAGPDGRLVLDPLCESVSKLLCDNGSLLLVQSAFAGVHRSLDTLRSSGLDAEVVASQLDSIRPGAVGASEVVGGHRSVCGAAAAKRSWW